MRLGTRDDEDQGRTRTVVWSDGSQTDLGVLIAAAVASSIFAASIVGAIELRGALHVTAIVVAVVAGLYASAMLVPLALVFGGIFVVKGMIAEKPSGVHRASWVVAAALLGALLGTDTYSVGVPGLLTGPFVIAIVWWCCKSLPTTSQRVRQRALGLSVVTAVAAVGVGLTIFV